MTEQTLFYRFGVALFIGILVGIQREHAYDIAKKSERKTAAGVRTFALISLVGCTAAFIADILQNPWVYVGLILAPALLITIGYAAAAWRGEMGMTTEVAALVTLFTGSLCYWGEMALAAALAVITTALLSLKLELHRLAENLTRADIFAALKFAIITAIVLPVLPNQSFGPPPIDVLNPYKIWLMVVLISGISFSGYVLIKIVGSQRGIWLTGLLGGLASSTAATLSFAQRSHADRRLAKSFALAITLAWTVMFARILVAVGAVYAPLLSVLWLPIVLAGGAGLAYVIYLHLTPHDDDEGSEVKVSNPFELRPAITFGLLYGVILLLVRAASLYFGDVGLYLSSLVSGLADVDAITLSVTELSRGGGLDRVTAARAVVLAAMANTAVKGGIVLSSGSPELRRAFWPGCLLILAVGSAAALLL